MRLWKNRPLFAWASVFMGASLAGFFLAARAKAILAGACLLAALLLLIFLLWRRPTREHPLPYRGVLAVLLLLGATLGLFRSLWTIDRTEAKIAPFENEVCEVTATVKECRGMGGQMSTYAISVSSVNGEKLSYDALLTCYYVSDLQAGHEIVLTAEAISLSEAAGDIYEEYALLGDGIFGGFLSLQETDYTVISEEPTSLSLMLARHRSALSERLELTFGERAAGLPSALLLGVRTHLSDATKRDFSRTGVSHLLAISGLHMTMIFGALALLLKLFRLPPRLRAVILGAGAWAYLIYLGFPPSATRAVVMLGMTYLSALCFAEADPLTSLGVAGAAILLISPLSVADVGFWMSFSATLGLLTLSNLGQSKDKTSDKGATSLLRRGTRKLWGGLATGAAAITFSLWVTSPVIGQFSLLSLPLTLLLSPLIGLMLLLVPLSALLSPTPLGPLLITVVQGISSCITTVCARGAKPSWAVISLRHPAIPVISLVMILLILLFLGLSLSRKGLVLLPMAAGWVIIGVLLGVQAHTASEALEVSYLIPSTTSEMLVMTQGNRAVICEFSNGSRRAFLTASKEAAQRGATEISAVVLTDYHSRTSGALLQLTQRDMVRAVWLPKPTSAEDYYLMLACLDALGSSDTQAVIYEYGEALTVFDVACLSVERTSLKRSVQPVLLVTLETPAETLTLCGRSILESDLALPALVSMAESKTVILSNKGPVLKAAVHGVFGPETRSLYLADATVAAYLSPASYPDERVTVTIGQGRFKLSLSP